MAFKATEAPPTLLPEKGKPPKFRVVPEHGQEQEKPRDWFVTDEWVEMAITLMCNMLAEGTGVDGMRATRMELAFYKPVIRSWLNTKAESVVSIPFIGDTDANTAALVFCAALFIGRRVFAAMEHRRRERAARPAPTPAPRATTPPAPREWNPAPAPAPSSPSTPNPMSGDPRLAVLGGRVGSGEL